MKKEMGGTQGCASSKTEPELPGNDSDREHETATICIKTAAIDVLMVPVIQWLNSFEEVCTSGCCEGWDDGPPERPYVQFTCSSLLSLALILRRFRKGGYCYPRADVCWFTFPDGLEELRFLVQFLSKQKLRDFIAQELKVSQDA
jgi:hypothetical protein